MHHIASIFLEVRASNKTAIHLYESMGFIEVSLRKKYYPHPKLGREDAILYARELI
jgi:ribosomal-protein-alanine N-acetyltransferase